MEIPKGRLLTITALSKLYVRDPLPRDPANSMSKCRNCGHPTEPYDRDLYPGLWPTEYAYECPKCETVWKTYEDDQP